MKEWLAAFDRDDLQAVRRLFAPDGVVYVHGRVLRGWGEFIGWYGPWRDSLDGLPGFGYEYEEVSWASGAPLL